MGKGGFIMSKRTWGIVLSVFALFITAALSFWYFGRDTSTPPEEQRGTELVEMLPTDTNSNQASAAEGLPDWQNPKEDRNDLSTETATEAYEFVLVNNDNYVAVYRLPENEIYEYTDVIMDVLPAELQEEIQRGKYLRNEEELYNFLENYTS